MLVFPPPPSLFRDRPASSEDTQVDLVGPPTEIRGKWAPWVIRGERVEAVGDTKLLEPHGLVRFLLPIVLDVEHLACLGGRVLRFKCLHRIRQRIVLGGMVVQVIILAVLMTSIQFVGAMVPCCSAIICSKYTHRGPFCGGKKYTMLG